jgi:hypothetical protein
VILITSRAVIIKAASDLILTSNDIKSKYRSRVMCVREDAAMHHPEALGCSGVDYIDMGSTIMIAAPNSIYPTWLIKAIHAGLVYFCASALKLSYKQVLDTD